MSESPVTQRSVAAAPRGSPLSFMSLALLLFVASAATMAVEIAAGRMISRHLGASIYTWTSVIGIVLAGLAIGNYLGGLIADYKNSRGSLSLILLIAAFACALIPIADAFAAGWSAIWMLSWPARTAVHVAIAFMLPALSLGLIAPMVIKLALDSGMARGRAVGVLSAAGALGSLAGTFAAGFVLIEWIGTMGVTSAAAGLLALIALFSGSAMPRVWMGAAISVAPIGYVWAFTGFDPSQVSRLAVWRSADARPTRPILATESAYSYIEVYAMNESGRVRGMKLDSLVHSEINLDAPHDLQYEYERIFAAITNRLHPDAKQIDTLTIGGGGYVFPRYLAETRPNSKTDVVEIDPAVTKSRG
ncbi:MAG: fused MFS/spermidine synthase [Planctomycetes bacterium]|nr:fused MFS/spermidine synthase [Planctomycetota bacterium]